MSWSTIVGQLAQPVTPTTKKPEIPATHKRCKGCEKLLPREQFYPRGELNGLMSRCKPCYMNYQASLKKSKPHAAPKG